MAKEWKNSEGVGRGKEGKVHRERDRLELRGRKRERRKFGGVNILTLGIVFFPE